MRRVGSSMALLGRCTEVVHSEPDFGPEEIRSYLKVTGWTPVSGGDVAELWSLPGPSDEVVLVP